MKSLYLIVLFSCLGCSGNSPEDSFHVKLSKDLDQYIVELPQTSPLIYSDRFLENLIAWHNYSVIGLGESTHGTKEFFELKTRLFKYLVEHHGYKILAYEFNFRSSLRINNYVLYGIGDLDSLFAGELWIQDNYEVQNLVDWIFNYNKDKELEQKVKFVGIDNQLDAFYPEKTIDWIQNNFPEIILQNNLLIDRIINLEHIRYKEITTKEYERRRDLFEELMKATNDYFKKTHGDPKSIDQKITIHLIESLLNSNTWLFNIYTGKRNNRDVDLAENLLWAKDCYNSKVVLWAHTSHIQNNPEFSEDDGGSMGYYLRKSLNGSYLIVSTLFTNGRFKAVMEGPDGHDTPPLDCEISGIPPSGSINEIFYRTKYNNFFLDVSEIQTGTPLYLYFDTIRPMLGIGDWFEGSPEFHYSSSHRRINLLEATDLVFYYSNTNPVRIHNRFAKIE